MPVDLNGSMRHQRVIWGIGLDSIKRVMDGWPRRGEKKGKKLLGG